MIDSAIEVALITSAAPTLLALVTVWLQIKNHSNVGKLQSDTHELKAEMNGHMTQLLKLKEEKGEEIGAQKERDRDEKDAT